MANTTNTNTGTFHSSPPLSPFTASPLQAAASSLVLPLPSIKLTEKNCLVWLHSILATLTLNRANRFVLGTGIHHRFLKEDDRLVNSVNPAYLRWEELDQTIFPWILNSLSEGLQPRVVGCRHSWQLWEELDSYCNSHTKARSRQLRSQLRSIFQGSSSISEYFTTIKGLVDSLIYVSTPISPAEHIDYILDGLNEEYQLVITFVESQLDLPLVHNLESFLLTFESCLEKNKGKALSNALSADIAVNAISPPSSRTITSHPRHASFPFQAPPNSYVSPRNEPSSHGFDGGNGGFGSYRGNIRGGRNTGGRNSGRFSPSMCVYCNRSGYDVHSCYYAPLNFVDSSKYAMPRNRQGHFSNYTGPSSSHYMGAFSLFLSSFC
ncbi:unnamed protein product [Lupinus luteus]|uniref:Retrotransposon gag domain-containing protein n=1 Tax=Lupinus luteus TaxID=3873 RepID=A0AAV1X616_LUPLU